MKRLVLLTAALVTLTANSLFAQGFYGYTPSYAPTNYNVPAYGPTPCSQTPPVAPPCSQTPPVQKCTGTPAPGGWGQPIGFETPRNVITPIAPEVNDPHAGHGNHGPSNYVPTVARVDIWQLSPQQRAQTCQLMLQYINDQIVIEHGNMNHSDGEMFLVHHRTFIHGMERFLNQQGIGLPLWNPATPIPAEFMVVEQPENGGPARPALVNPNPRMPVPNYLTGNNLARFQSIRELGSAMMRPWHDEVHTAVGGSMADLNHAAAAPLFWSWHGFIDQLYANWEMVR